VGFDFLTTTASNQAKPASSSSKKSSYTESRAGALALGLEDCAQQVASLGLSDSLQGCVRRQISVCRLRLLRVPGAAVESMCRHARGVPPDCRRALEAQVCRDNQCVTAVCPQLCAMLSFMTVCLSVRRERLMTRLPQRKAERQTLIISSLKLSSERNKRKAARHQHAQAGEELHQGSHRCEIISGL
jgi:hypothetical protein